MKSLVDPYADPVPQPPPYPSRYGRTVLATVVLAVVFGYAAQIVELRPLELVRDIGNIGVFLKGYLHPALLTVSKKNGHLICP